MNSIIITRAGTHSTIQDFGRFQYQHLGVSPGGAMDQRIITELQKIIPNHQNQFLLPPLTYAFVFLVQFQKIQYPM